ncbi:hypothetical protein GMORB2_1069 [Geosmithia morbida]|uniref:Uncharacterized protein n=1 Tax=Geosmithia morbida TaxID=1094350 RepID=A0A9P5D353_9HYPO|nr:uncharacterized protein GMORB2_1069 [Geosmithia morbida]KAF4125823.1 hypothetical protein GMORB2_1069 [Geosmithia morbida]
MWQFIPMFACVCAVYATALLLASPDLWPAEGKHAFQFGRELSGSARQPDCRI